MQEYSYLEFIDWDDPDKNRDSYLALRSAIDAFTASIGVSITVGQLGPSHVHFAADSDTMKASLINTIEMMDISLMVYLLHQESENDKMNLPNVSLWMKRDK